VCWMTVISKQAIKDSW